MYRRYRRSRSHLPLGIFFLLVLAGLAAVFFTRFAPEFINSRFGKFDRFNVVAATPQVALISLDLTAKSATVIRFPDDLYITDVTHGYGQYKISSVFAAGELDHRGGETLSSTVSDFLGVPVEGFIRKDGDSSDFRKYFLNPEVILSQVSNLSLIDRLRFILTFMQTRFDRIKTSDLGNMASPLILADGSKTFSLEKGEVDNLLLGKLVEGSLQKEGLRVEVVNTTNVPGLGARATRLLNNIGLSVVNIENGSVPVTNCQIFTSENALKSLTVARIANLYSCAISKKSDEGRAAVTVFLGQNYVDTLTK